MAIRPCRGWPRWLLGLTSFAVISITVAAANDGNWTLKHEAGRCAIRGHCGKQSLFFGSQLPCPDNGLAETPQDSLRDKLVGLCGEKWKHSDVCCDEDQVCRSSEITESQLTFMLARLML